MVDMSIVEVDRLLTEALIGRLAMADRDGRPYVIPLPFCWYGGALYVRLARSGRKGAVLEQNDRVCFEVDRFDAQLSDYASVLVEGTLFDVTNREEKSTVKTIT